MGAQDGGLRSRLLYEMRNHMTTHGVLGRCTPIETGLVVSGVPDILWEVKNNYGNFSVYGYIECKQWKRKSIPTSPEIFKLLSPAQRGHFLLSQAMNVCTHWVVVEWKDQDKMYLISSENRELCLSTENLSETALTILTHANVIH